METCSSEPHQRVILVLSVCKVPGSLFRCTTTKLEHDPGVMSVLVFTLTIHFTRLRPRFGLTYCILNGCMYVLYMHLKSFSHCYRLPLSNLQTKLAPVASCRNWNSGKLIGYETGDNDIMCRFQACHVLVAGSLGDRGTTHSRDAFGPRCNISPLRCLCSLMGLFVVTMHDIMARAWL